MYFNKLLQDEVQEKADPNDIVLTVRGKDIFDENALEPDVKELLSILENADQWITDYLKEDALNEGIVNKTKEAIKVAKVKAAKADRAFNEFVMKRVREMRTNRRNRRHSEMVGESLKINTYLKRILKAGSLSIINPAIGVISFCVDTLIDKKKLKF